MTETPQPDPAPPAGDPSPRAGEPPSRAARWHRLRRFWPVIPLGLILIALMLEDLHVMGWSPFEADSCGIAELDQSSLSAKLYNPLAQWGVRHTGVPQVAIVYIDSTVEPAELLTNTCASRVFLARVVRDLNKLGAGVIVIDKYYTENACGDAQTNTLFKNALEASPVPVVVGQPTHPLSNSEKLEGCMGISQGFPFDPKKNVRTGLTRLNTDTLKIPVRWPVFDDLDHPKATPVLLPDAAGDSLSLAAAKAETPDIETLGPMPSLLAAGTHPYTTFIDPPSIHAMNVICATEDKPLYAEGQAIPCAANGWKPASLASIDGKGLNLLGKVVVIGDVSDSDMQPFPKQVQPFPAGQVPGVYLQANYIESLLDQRFLTETPTWLTVTFLIVFVLGIYCLYWAHDANQVPLLTPEKALIGSIILLGSMVLLSIIALLALGYFTPVWALWGAGFFLVFKYLESSGHHRSQHLLGELWGHKHPGPHEKVATADAGPPTSTENRE